METFTYKTAAFQKGISKEGAIVANNWANRPEDERFISLDDLISSKREKSRTMSDCIVDVNSKNFKVIGQDSETNLMQGKMFVEFKDETTGQWHQTEPTNWGFNQVATLGSAPASYMRKIPASLAAECVYWGIANNRKSQFVKPYSSTNGTLAAITGQDYGRIYDHDVAQCVKDAIYNTQFKVPGALNNNGEYDPFYGVNKKSSTTLFASDRDIFLFMVDDLNPIEVGKLPNGDPDLMFRGFYVSNSEVGAKSFRLGTMYLRGICMNRCLWGVENFQEIKINHTKFALSRFVEQAAPALKDYSNGNSQALIDGVTKAKETTLASTDEEMIDYFRKRVGLSERMAQEALKRHEEEEQHPARNAWDAAQAITAVARDIPHQDSRFDLEKKAGQLLDKVAA